MGSKKVKRRLMLAARPSLRKHPRPPKARTLMGESFSMANFSGALVLQHCQVCGLISYPPRERCRSCLSDELRWRQTDTSGEVVSCTHIHISQWEFFKRKVKDAPWPIVSVKLAGQILFTHLAVETFWGLGEDFKSNLSSASPRQRLQNKTFETKGSAFQQKTEVLERPPSLQKGERGGFKAPTTHLLPAGTKVKVFSQSDSAKKSVLIAASVNTDITKAGQRKAIAVAMGISEI